MLLAFGQNGNDLFDLLPEAATANMRAQAAEKLASLRQSNNYTSVTPIRMRDIAEVQRNGAVRIPFPHTSAPVVFQTTNIESFGDGTYEWYGTSKRDPASYALIQNDGEGPYGFAVVDGISYQIQSISNQHVLLRSNDKEFFDRDCGTTALTDHTYEDGFGKAPKFEKHHCDEEATIRILTLYTDRASQVVANISQKAGNLIGQCRLARKNSGLDAHDIDFEGAGVRRLADFVESGDINDDVDRLRDRGETPGNFVEQLRDDSGADLVILLTDGNYGAAGAAYQAPGFEDRG